MSLGDPVKGFSRLSSFIAFKNAPSLYHQKKGTWLNLGQRNHHHKTHFLPCKALEKGDLRIDFPRSQLLTTGSDRKVAYWDTFDGQAIRVLEGSEEGEITTLSVSLLGAFKDDKNLEAKARNILEWWA